MLTALQRSGGIDALARQAGVDPPQALAVARVLLPSMLALLRNKSGDRAGMLAQFETQGGAGLAAAVMAVEQADVGPGQAILLDALGADAAILADLATKAGATSERLVPLLVMLVGGYVSALAAGHGTGQQRLDSLLGYAR